MKFEGRHVKREREREREREPGREKEGGRGRLISKKEKILKSNFKDMLLIFLK